MNKLLKLTLITALTATSGFATETDIQVNGMDINISDAPVVVGNGRTLANSGNFSATTASSMAIEVGTSGKLLGASGQVAGTSSSAGGTVTGDVARHWSGKGGMDWEAASSGHYVVGSNVANNDTHGLISNGLTLDAASGNTAAMPYEVFDGGVENKLARMYRDLSTGTGAIAGASKIETGTIHLTKKSSSGFATDAGIGAGEYPFSFENIVAQNGATPSGPDSVKPEDIFVVNTNLDSGAGATNTISADLSSATVQDYATEGEMASLLQLVAPSAKAIVLSGANDGLAIPVQIGQNDATSAVPGFVTINDTGALPASYINVEPASKLTLGVQNGTTGLTLSRNVNFRAAGSITLTTPAVLDAKERLTITSGVTVSFGASDDISA